MAVSLAQIAERLVLGEALRRRGIGTGQVLKGDRCPVPSTRGAGDVGCGAGVEVGDESELDATAAERGDGDLARAQRYPQQSQCSHGLWNGPGLATRTRDPYSHRQAESSSMGIVAPFAATQSQRPR